MILNARGGFHEFIIHAVANLVAGKLNPISRIEHFKLKFNVFVFIFTMVLGPLNFKRAF